VAKYHFLPRRLLLAWRFFLRQPWLNLGIETLLIVVALLITRSARASLPGLRLVAM